jgi:hypothetical protein
LKSAPLLIAILICGLGLTAVARGAELLDGNLIARNVEHVNRFHAVRNISYGKAKYHLTLVRRLPGQAPRINTLERQRKNDYGPGEVAARDRVVFHSGQLRGTGILVTDYEDLQRGSSYVVWLPNLRKLRRFTQPDPSDAWGGSNFTYGDVYLRRAHDETHELLAQEPFPDCLGALQLPAGEHTRYTKGMPEPSCTPRGRMTYKLKSRPREADTAYDYRIVWVDRETFADYRSEFYKDGRLLKRIDKDWHSMDLDDPRGLFWSYWYAISPGDGNQGMAFIDPRAVSWNDDLHADVWSESNLRRSKR